MNKTLYNEYVRILNEELLPATGCTEPIAVAYAAAISREALGKLPERVQVLVSGNILKNVKSVIVPNTGGLKGIASAAAAGIIAGNPNNKLKVLAFLTDSERKKISEFLNTALRLAHFTHPTAQACELRGTTQTL